MLANKVVRALAVNLKVACQKVILRDQIGTTKQLFARSMSSGKGALDLSGVFPPIATPFDENEDISWENLEHNVYKWNEIDFKGKMF